MKKILLNNFIKISKGFAYSVNIKWDLHNLEKINSYVPTKDSIEFSKKILKDRKGAHLLVGSYGTGKSHLVSVLVSLIMGKFNSLELKNLLEKIKKSDADLFNVIDEIINKRSKKIIVFPEDSLSDFKQAILVGIKNSLKLAKLDDIIPRTYFDAIRDKLDNWLEKYNDVYNLFIENLKNEYDIEIEQFIIMLENLDTRAYEIFNDIYPKLTAGSVFSPIYYVDLIEYIQGIEHHLKKRGYDGLYITFDEFGKYLEENIESINTKDIQSLAEYCNTKDSNTGMILITHKDFAQYTKKLNKDIVYEWRKIEGRFNKSYLRTDKYQSYEIISQIIIKDEKIWNEFKSEYKDKFNEIRYNMLSIKLFQDLPVDLFNKIIEGLYPLNPSATFCLVKLSEKLAQNERTMFTFLCSDEKSSLKSYISRNFNKFPLINVELIYDYFENLMKTDGVGSETYDIWKKSNRSLQLIDENSIFQRNIIKALAVINIINNIDILPPNKTTIKTLLNMSDADFEKSIQELLNSKILFERKSIEHYLFYESSYIDIFKEIEKREASLAEDYITILNNDFQPVPILPRKYNDNNYINRYFLCEFIDLKHLKSNYIDKISNNYLDGKIYYFIPENPEELEEATKVIEGLTYLRQSIFVVPKIYLPFKDIVKRYSILQEMLEDEEFLKKDPILYDEIYIYINETREEINKLLSNILNNDYKNIIIYYQGKIVKGVSTRIQLSNKLSEICSVIYSQSPVINNELVNKDNLTSTMKKVMKDVIEKIWQDDLQKDLGFKPFSAEHTLTKTMLINTNILRKDKSNYIINYSDSNVSGKLKNIMLIIEDFIQSSREKEKRFIDLYKKLKNPPYGLRDGIIPIFIALVIKNYKDILYVKDRGVYIDLEANIPLDMVKRPENFTIILDVWDNDKRKYIESLETFLEPDSRIVNKNRLRALYIALKEKYIKLPKFARVTEMLSEETIKLRNIIDRDYNDYRTLFYERLPDIYNNNYRNTYKGIVKAFDEMSKSVEKLEEEINVFLINQFKRKNNVETELKSVLINWYNSLKDSTKTSVYSAKTEIVLDFIKNIENIGLPVDYIAAKLTGLSLEYFSDGILDVFKKDIMRVLHEIDDKEKISLKNKNIVNIMINSSSTNINKTIEEVAATSQANILKRKIETDIRFFGNSLNKDEKILVLLDLLKKFLK